MSYFEDHIQCVAEEVKARMEVEDFMNALITDIKYRKMRGEIDTKPLEFLIDAEPEARISWLEKALITATYHDILGNPSCPVEFFLACKKQMKIDRDTGLKLW